MTLKEFILKKNQGNPNLINLICYFSGLKKKEFLMLIENPPKLSLKTVLAIKLVVGVSDGDMDIFFEDNVAYCNSKSTGGVR